jgi:hypothetical protein
MKNAITIARGSSLRRKELIIIKKCGYEGWKYLKDAGKRGIAEIVFSSIKRVVGRRSSFNQI